MLVLVAMSWIDVMGELSSGTRRHGRVLSDGAGRVGRIELCECLDILKCFVVYTAEEVSTYGSTT